MTARPCTGGSLGLWCDRRSTCVHHAAWVAAGGESGVPWPLVSVPAERELCANQRDYLPIHIPTPAPANAPQLEMFA